MGKVWSCHYRDIIARPMDWTSQSHIMVTGLLMGDWFTRTTIDMSLHRKSPLSQCVYGSMPKEKRCFFFDSIWEVNEFSMDLWVHHGLMVLVVPQFILISGPMQGAILCLNASLYTVSSHSLKRAKRKARGISMYIIWKFLLLSAHFAKTCCSVIQFYRCLKNLALKLVTVLP